MLATDRMIFFLLIWSTFIRLGEKWIAMHQILALPKLSLTLQVNRRPAGALSR